MIFFGSTILSTTFGDTSIGTVMDAQHNIQHLRNVKLKSSTVDNLAITAGLPQIVSEPGDLRPVTEVWLKENVNLNDRFTLRSIMVATFNGHFESGSIQASDYTITHIIVSRRVFGAAEEWQDFNLFKLDDSNYYRVTDRFPLSNVQYEYGFKPIANELVGTPLISDPYSVNYRYPFITNASENIPMKYNVNIGPISQNNIMGQYNPLNRKYPIVTFGNSDYKSGQINFLPVSIGTENRYGSSIDIHQEKILRDRLLQLLANGKAKVLRLLNENVLVVTDQTLATPMLGGTLALYESQFNYTEIGPTDFRTLFENDLMEQVGRYNLSFDDDGSIIINDNSNR